MNIFNEARKAATKLHRIAVKRREKLERIQREHDDAVKAVIEPLDGSVIGQLISAGLIPSQPLYLEESPGESSGQE